MEKFPESIESSQTEQERQEKLIQGKIHNQQNSKS